MHYTVGAEKKSTNAPFSAISFYGRLYLRKPFLNRGPIPYAVKTADAQKARDSISVCMRVIYDICIRLIHKLVSSVVIYAYGLRGRKLAETYAFVFGAAPKMRRQSALRCTAGHASFLKA